MNKPKYNYDDVVSFELEHNDKTYLCTGKVYIVDKYGTIEQNEEPSYDIMVDNFLGGKEPCLVKHIRESSIEDKSMPKDFLEEHFVKGAEKCSSPEDILNWYRNLYYKEDKNTERRIVAEAINEFFVKKLPELLKEAKIVATDTVDAYMYANLRNAVDTQFLYEDVIQPVIERYKNEVKNDKM